MVMFFDLNFYFFLLLNFGLVTTTLLNFVKMFKKAHDENCKQLEFERKKAEKEASAEKAKKMNMNASMENLKTTNTQALKERADNQKMNTLEEKTEKSKIDILDRIMSI